MLFTHEWYPHFPAGFGVETINGQVRLFVLGKTDNDIRFGCLVYGVPAVDGVKERD